MDANICVCVVDDCQYVYVWRLHVVMTFSWFANSIWHVNCAHIYVCIYIFILCLSHVASAVYRPQPPSCPYSALDRVCIGFSALVTL